MTKRPPKPGRESLARRDIVKIMKQKYLKDLGLSKKAITEVLNAFLEVYKESILEHNRIEIRNFGVIHLKLIPGRLIHHPETKEETISTPHYRIAFIPSKTFRDQLKDKAKEEIVKT